MHIYFLFTTVLQHLRYEIVMSLKIDDATLLFNNDGQLSP